MFLHRIKGYFTSLTFLAWDPILPKMKERDKRREPKSTISTSQPYFSMFPGKHLLDTWQTKNYSPLGRRVTFEKNAVTVQLVRKQGRWI